MLLLMVNKLPSVPLVLALSCYASITLCADTSNDSSSDTSNMQQEDRTEVSSEANADIDSAQTSDELQAVLSLEVDIEFGAYLSGECLTCHLPNIENGAIPLIHGKDKDYLANGLLEYRNKQRPNTVMQGVSAGLTNDEIAALATYLSEQ